jgi:hypothetical protein
LAFDALGEMADLAIDYAEALKDAAMQGDRLRARLYACQLSRVTRSALLTLADIFAEPQRLDAERPMRMETLGCARALTAS